MGCVLRKIADLKDIGKCVICSCQKTKYRIHSNNKFQLTKVRKSYLKPSHVKNKSKTKTNPNKKSSKKTKSNNKKLRWVYLRVFSRLFAHTFLKWLNFFRFKFYRNLFRRQILSNCQKWKFLSCHQRQK